MAFAEYTAQTAEELMTVLKTPADGLPSDIAAARLRRFILETAPKKDFQTELSAFLPIDRHNIIRDFPGTLESELNRQVAE